MRSAVAPADRALLAALTQYLECRNNNNAGLHDCVLCRISLTIIASSQRIKQYYIVNPTHKNKCDFFTAEERGCAEPIVLRWIPELKFEGCTTINNHNIEKKWNTSQNKNKNHKNKN